MKSEQKLIYYELLVLRCQKGERKALEELIKRWEKSLFYYLHRLVDDEEDAWDTLQETWVKVIKEIKSLREPCCLPIWLYRIARNTAMSKLRAEYYKRAVLDDLEESQNVLENDENSNFENAEQIHQALGQLSLPHREILTLHFLEYFSIEEIAVVLGVPPGTVKSRIYYAKWALRSVIKREG